MTPIVLYISTPGVGKEAVEVEPDRSLTWLKEKVSAAIGIERKKFALTFEGDEVGNDKDDRQISDLSVEDGCAMDASLTLIERTRLELEDMGWEGWELDDIDDAMENSGNSADDIPFSKALTIMCEGGFTGDKETLFRTAAKHGYTSCLAVLAGYISSVDAKDGNGWSAVHYVARQSTATTMRLLVSLEANPHIASKYGGTPLHCSAMSGNLPCLKYLLSTCKADARAADCNGRTPLHWAAFAGRCSIFQPLLDGGADTGLRDNGGQTARDVALQQGFRAAAEML
eukprot:TRINITY_DN388_c2_g2_i1.p1 TRINITY_DN388_c2_g2~~TRINITY_DN388_c2_g2_i1.p1  ORF type:complete len:285 (+),score=36.53 TRINITY_DN388_c2_g2_i1:51-905(+)